jgi:hypothetical protein
LHDSESRTFVVRIQFLPEALMIAKPFTLLLLALPSLPGWAHEGHHLPGTHHWHATDVFGYVALAVVIGLAWWLSGRK